MAHFTRRDFIKATGFMTLGATLSPQMLWAKSFSDFKAMVIVNMMGGNDALNMFVPGASTQTGQYKDYDTYASLRNSETRIDAKDFMNDLKNLVDSNGNIAFGAISDAPYYDNTQIASISCKKGFYLHNGVFGGKIGTNVMMPEFANWIEKGRVAVVQNVGNISGPWSKEALKNDPTKLPPFIFAHDHQSRLMQMGKAGTLTGTTGWLGRLGDTWKLHESGVYEMNINISPFGTNTTMFGATSLGMDYSNVGPKSVDMTYYNQTLEASFGNRSVGNMFGNLYIRNRKRVFERMTQTLADWQDVVIDNNPFLSVTDSYGNKIYTRDALGTKDKGIRLPAHLGLNKAATYIVDDFRTAARLIYIARKRGMHRVVIAIDMPGFDQHAGLLMDHGSNMRGLSLGLDAFLRAMASQNLLDSVAVAGVSEFSRSTGANGNGTDHAWGGAQFVAGAVQPGIYGEMPDLRSESEDDLSRQGRLIPSTSYSQYYATLLKWFGATESERTSVLPELGNFATKDIGFMKL